MLRRSASLRPEAGIRSLKAGRRQSWLGLVTFLCVQVTFAHYQARQARITVNELREDIDYMDLDNTVKRGVFEKNRDDQDDIEYDVINPVRVASNGDFLSSELKYIINDGGASKSRLKRDIREKENFIYFKFEVAGKIMHLNLTENTDLLNSDFLVERLKPQVHSETPPSRSSVKPGSQWRCHFRGHVIGHPMSKVALSTCDGLRGLIRLKGGDYLIEPHGGDISTLDNKQRHKIYKRDVTRKIDPEQRNGVGRDDEMSNRKLNMENRQHHSFCGVQDTRRRYRKDLARRARWESRQNRQKPSGSERKRRSLSLEHWIEMLVVVDKKMVEYYEAYHEGEVEKYVLTIINMVYELFHDVSIGNSLHIKLTRLIILEGDEAGLKITPHAEKTLDSFCRWAKRMNPKSDYDANHHDVAVLMTRRNICSNSNKSCETLGLAHVAGMCQSHRSCNVNQDTGLSLAFTVAHELGHNFAMHHDGQLNDCKPSEKSPHVMAPHLTSNNLPMQWSSCSRRYITRFLDRNWGHCLMDKPERPKWNASIELPGLLYNADHQCRLMFGPKSRHCKGIDNICNRLWCLSGGTCRSRLHSAVEGTKCGNGKWCFGGSCTIVGRRPTAVDGAWGTWSEWSTCSRTCGVGVTYSARFCDNPTPQSGGKFCLGERRKYRTCNRWACPPSNSTLTFRAEQCAAFNKVPYRNKTYTWHPVNSQVYPCELHCYTKEGNTPFADRLSDKVVDGTTCFSHSNDICVDGICKRLGCDLQIDSPARNDICGKCRGDGTECSEVEHMFNLKQGDEYVKVGLLPMGASSVQVFEEKPSKNFLALRSTKNKTEYYLNGGYMIQWDTRFNLAGSSFTYHRVNGTVDNITADGPLTHDVEVMLLFVEKNPGVRITYVMPHNVTAIFAEKDKPTFKWIRQEWSICSRTCGTGVQKSAAICIEEKDGLVEEDFCDKQLKPNDLSRTCNQSECPPEWQKGVWGDCSVTCGGGIGRQRRSVTCVRSMSDNEVVALNQTDCFDMMKPKRSRACPAANQTPCPTWRPGEWGECSERCGGGIRERSIQCVTYAINDVIAVEGTDLPLGNSTSRSRDIIRFGSSLRNNHLDLLKDNFFDEYETEYIDTEPVGGFMIVERRDERNLLENHPYDVEKDKECDVTKKPDDTKKCNTHPCWSFRSKEIDENLLDVDLPIDPLLTITSLDVNNNAPGDVIQDIGTNILEFQNVLRNNSEFSEKINSENESILEYDNLFDIETNLNETDLIANNNLPNTTGSTFKKITTEFNYNKTTFDETTSFEIIVAATTVPTTIETQWETGIWGQCSTTCGVGARTRKVWCSAGPDSCQNLIKPAPAQRCNLKPCASWKYGGWGKCSKQCGYGIKQRKVHCRDTVTNQLLRPYHCHSLPKLPQRNTTCNMRMCLRWKTSRWSTCNVTCGRGIQRRRTACSREGMCDVKKRPKQSKPCSFKPCVEWRTSSWDTCSVNCGSGIKHRAVNCFEKESGKPSTHCNLRIKPISIHKCNRGLCRATDYDFTSCTGDNLKTSFCKVLRAYGKCVLPSLAIQCCSTCKTFTNVRRKEKDS